MCKRVYLSPKEVETELNKAREEVNFVGEVEKAAVKTMIETAKQNGRFGDKLLMVINPVYIHIPSWQRRLNVPRAANIGNNYNKYKWEVPKILFVDGKLVCVDGMHRMYGSFLGKIESVAVEIITDTTEQEAIKIFLGQGTDRKGMTPCDTYGASIKVGMMEHITLKRICLKNNVRVKGDIESVSNPVGILTSISDGVNLARNNPQLLDNILSLIGKLQWNGGGNIYDGKAYSAKVLRVLKKLFAYYEGKEDQMKSVLLNNCKGSEYFNNNLAEKWQDTLFDYLSDVVEKNINIESMSNKKPKRVSRKLTKVN